MVFRVFVLKLLSFVGIILVCLIVLSYNWPNMVAKFLPHNRKLCDYDEQLLFLSCQVDRNLLYMKFKWFFYFLTIFQTKKKKGENKKMEKIKQFFKFEERGANFRTEILGGIVTFLAMSYILVVNPGISSGLWSDQAGIPYGGVFFATCIGSFAATLIMALLAKLPVGLAPGMGVNAF